MKFAFLLTLLISCTTFAFAQKTETIVLKKEPHQGQTIIDIKDGNIIVDGKVVSNYPKTKNEVPKRIIIDAATDAPGASYWHGSETDNNRAVLGVQTLADEQPGALVTHVLKGSAAEKAGLQAGDRILAINETGIQNPAALVAAIGKLKAGDEIKVRYERDGNTASTDATLQAAPAVAPFGGQTMPNSMPFDPGQMPQISPQDLQELQQLFEQFQMPQQGPALGVGIEEQADGKGVLITSVQAGSPAEKAGLRTGDVLTHWNGNVITNISTLQQQVQGAKTDKKIEVRYQRGGKQIVTSVQFTAPAKKAQL